MKRTKAMLIEEITAKDVQIDEMLKTLDMANNATQKAFNDLQAQTNRLVTAKSQIRNQVLQIKKLNSEYDDLQLKATLIEQENEQLRVLLHNAKIKNATGPMPARAGSVSAPAKSASAPASSATKNGTKKDTRVQEKRFCTVCGKEISTKAYYFCKDAHVEAMCFGCQRKAGVSTDQAALNRKTAAAVSR